MVTDTTRRLAIVAAQWHGQIVDEQVDEARKRLIEQGWAVEVFTVPGAFEIPLFAQRLARTGAFDAIAACALVVDGGIYRHEFVADSVVDALMRIQLETDVPVFSGVLTPHHFHDHAEHQNYFSQHFRTKGAELARAVVVAVSALDGIPAGT